MTQYQPPPMAGQYGPVDPGRTLGIVGLVLAIFGSVIGLVISIIALRKSKAAGFKNGFALAGLIVGIITTITSLVVAGVLIFAAFTVAKNCQDLGSGVQSRNGVTYTCPR